MNSHSLHAGTLAKCRAQFLIVVAEAVGSEHWMKRVGAGGVHGMGGSCGNGSGREGSDIRERQLKIKRHFRGSMET